MWNTWLKKVKITIMLCFIVLSFIYISPEEKTIRSNLHSTELTKITEEKDHIIKTNYVDNMGRIAIAADMGYATVMSIKTEVGILEKYYDEKGKPISCYSGYYAILREFDENGNNNCNTYLDENDKPVLRNDGFSIEKKEFNEYRQVIAIRYFDINGKPVLTSYGYGKKYTYDKFGNICMIIYLDAFDNPLMINQGYAMVKRNFYSHEDDQNGKIESEFYYDEIGRPKMLSLGQYGAHMEYDKEGRVTVLTYLDEEGKPIITNKGYTTVKRTYRANNGIATEMYYDANGFPFSLLEGEYGIKKENGQTIYLDEGGNEKVNLRTILYNKSWLVIFLALIMIIVSFILGIRENIFMLIIYVLGIVYLTLLFRDKDNMKSNIDFFWTLKNIIISSEARASAIRNIWLFIPLGAILYKIIPHKSILLIPLLISVIIEIIQYIEGTGMCDLDDVICNSLGGCIGFDIEMMLCEIGNVSIKTYKKRNNT